MVFLGAPEGYVYTHWGYSIGKNKAMSNINDDTSTGSITTSQSDSDNRGSFVDEAGLLPGAEETRITSGLLTLPSHMASIKFAPVAEQRALLDPTFTSHAKELNYTLSHHDQLLTATAGVDGNIVFTAKINDNGSYLFTLYDHIDRASPPNLLTPHYELSLWQVLDDPIPTKISLTHDIETNHGAPYQLTFYYKPDAGISEITPIQIYWDDQLIHTLYPMDHQEKGYIFSVDGSFDQNMTKLQFVGIPSESHFKEHFHDISVISMSQDKIPLDIGVLMTNEQGNTTHDHFMVNVTTTPAIEITNQEPFDVVYDQGVYQTIIVNEENFQNNPLTTLNLDTLFNHLSIPAENRHVEVVQLEENGLATNVYEVKISDKNEHLEPITVADVHLSFPGGNGGLSVFQKNILIDEGGGGLFPYHLEHQI